MRRRQQKLGGHMVNLYSAVKYICEKSGWKVSNLKVQKILYMAHMIHMGRNGGERLVDTSFEAWDYGPVEPNLYHKVKAFGSKPIPNIFKNIPDPEGQEEKVLKEACEHLLHRSHDELVTITHDECGAWAKNYMPGIRGIKILDDDILSEYREILGGSGDS